MLAPTIDYIATMLSSHSTPSKVPSKVSVLQRLVRKAKGELNAMMVFNSRLSSYISRSATNPDENSQLASIRHFNTPSQPLEIVSAIGKKLRSSLCMASDFLPFDFNSSVSGVSDGSMPYGSYPDGPDVSCFSPVSAVELKPSGPNSSAFKSSTSMNIFKTFILQRWFFKLRPSKPPSHITSREYPQIHSCSPEISVEDSEAELPHRTFGPRLMGSLTMRRLKKSRYAYETIRAGTGMNHQRKRTEGNPRYSPNNMLENGDMHALAAISWMQDSPPSDTYPPHIGHYRRYQIPREDTTEYIQSELEVSRNNTMVQCRLASLFDASYVDAPETAYTSAGTSDYITTSSSNGEDESSINLKSLLIYRKRNRKTPTSPSKLAPFEDPHHCQSLANGANSLDLYPSNESRK